MLLWLKNCWAFWNMLVQRFLQDRVLTSAAALTYTTLFAVVPLMTVTFSMLSVIPAFQDAGGMIQDFVFKNFVPSTGNVVQQYLSEFTTQARQLTWIGVVVLAVTAFLMLVTIEKTFNSIWRVRHARRGVSSFLLYWAVLSLGPLLLGAGLAVSTYVTSLSVMSGSDPLNLGPRLLGLTPVLMSIAAFTLLYAAVPNTRVPLRHALLGGIFTATLFELAKSLFGLYVHFFPSYQLIYGAFATFPLFLLWIYLSWIIVLLGAELVCCLSLPKDWRRDRQPPLLALLGVLRVLHDHQVSGETLSTESSLRRGWRMAEEQWRELSDFLIHEQFVCQVSGGGWALCRDLHSLTLAELLRKSPWPLPQQGQLPEHFDEPWYPAFRDALQQLEQEQDRLFSGSLAQWLELKGKA